VPDRPAGTDRKTRVGAFLVDEPAFEHVGLLDLDVLVVGKHGARRKAHQRGDEPTLAVE